MIPTYRYSVSSPMPLDLNEDQNHQLFSTNHQPSSSSSSLSYPILFNPDQDQDRPRSYYWEPKQLQSDEEGERIIPHNGSWDHPAVEKIENSSDLKLKVWKKEDKHENIQAQYGSVKWMSSKMRMMRRMMASDQKGSDTSSISNQKFEEQKQQLSPLGTDNNSSNNSSNHSNITVRVCADCHTTKTPLWRSGPKGPKSLCNACGIRQRKARRALAAAAAAASANGTILTAAEPSHVKRNKFHSKEKLKIDCAPRLKKKHKLGAKPCRGRKKFGFEELTISLSKNLALLQVFPQDEKEAAIMLMALSYGLLHGFPSDRYLDL